MAIMACAPILLNPTDTYGRNAAVSGVITMTGKGQTTREVVETIGVTLRANPSGKIENYDLSPIVAGVCRKHFEAAEASHQFTYDYSCNAWYLTVSVNGKTVMSDTAVLFGCSAGPSVSYVQPHLLRRNTGAIHFYIGLPGEFAELTPMYMSLFDANLKLLKTLRGNAPVAVTFYAGNLGVGPGDYYLSGDVPFSTPVWDDSRIWLDKIVWMDDTPTEVPDTVAYPLVIHPDPRACIRAGGKIYVRYWNSVGAWSYALLGVLRNDLKATTDYSDAWRLDANPVNGRIYGDRVQTDKEMTYTITAGRDGLDRLDVDELRDMQRAYCVQVWDVDREVWRDCYVQDATTQDTGGRGQEMTFTIEMPHEYTFTR